jgi:hypothetical protein
MAFLSGVDSAYRITLQIPSEHYKGLCSLATLTLTPTLTMNFVQTLKAYAFLQYASTNPETLGVNHGDTRLDNFFFYNEDAEKGGAPAAGVLDFQIMMRADISHDVAYFLGSSCTPDFQAQHETELLDLYFTQLAANGGPSIHPGTEDRASWEESYDLGLNVLMCKMVIGVGGIDPTAPRVVPQMNQLASGIGALHGAPPPPPFLAAASIGNRNPWTGAMDGAPSLVTTVAHCCGCTRHNAATR